MTPRELVDELEALVTNKIFDPVLILGRSGIGKTSIVDQVCRKHVLSLHSVRWGELAPVDARGVPVPDHELRRTVFYPPDFWPRYGPGVIFLDEFNMASTAMMGLGQRLLLDREFGSYRVPDDVYIWAAGNRKADKAAVNELPSPTDNRLAHYEVEPDFESWEFWAYANEQDSRIIGFLKWRSNLLHHVSTDPMVKAWPSPRTWNMAHRRLQHSMSIEPVVGAPTNAEFCAYMEMVRELPNVEKIAKGDGIGIPFPSEPSVQYALVAELTRRGMSEWGIFEQCFRWVIGAAAKQPEWVNSFVLDTLRILNRNDRNKNIDYMVRLSSMPEAKKVVKDYVDLTNGR